MCCKQCNKMSEYQLRQAAGCFFLLHMKQRGVPYERPLQLNSVGAEMWKLLQEGKTTEQLVEYMVKMYGIDAEEIKADILQFYWQLENYGIVIEG